MPCTCRLRSYLDALICTYWKSKQDSSIHCDGYIRIASLAFGTRHEYYTTLNTEFPLFIWTIHSTVLKLQITHRAGPRAPGCPRCPRVWFAQSLVPSHCRGQGPSLAPGPGMSRSQWISHHIPRRQFSFWPHNPKDKQYWVMRIGSWIWVDSNKQR